MTSTLPASAVDTAERNLRDTLTHAIEHRAPQIVVIEPGHDGWVVGKEPVVMVEFDFEGDTVNRLGMPSRHRHS